jgi:hypothetical protein
VMGFMSMTSAAGGWDVDRDAITQLHKNEMVLPANLAEGVRDMVSGGGSRQGPPATINVYAWDSKDVNRFFKEHGFAVQSGLGRSMRNFRR